MEKRVEVNIEGRVRVTSDEQSIEEAKRRAAEVEAVAESAGDGLDQTAEKARQVAREIERAFEDAAKGMGDRMRKALEEAAGGTTRPGALGKVDLSQTNPATLLSRVDRGLITTSASLAGARTYSELERIQGRLSTLSTYLEAAKHAGAPDERIESLEEALKELTEAVSEHKEALEKESERGTEQGPQPPEDRSDDSILRRLLERFGGGSLAQMGMLGNAMRFLGPFGLAIGAGVMGFRMLEGTLTRANQEGRNEVEIAADLARQYEYDRNPLLLFRRQKDLLTDRDLLRLGYTAQDAERYAAMLDLPGGMRGDVRALLRFSSTTGISEDQAAQLMHQLGMGGTWERGSLSQPLETFKLAMAEGVRLGISKSDTMQGLLRVTQESAARGVQSTQATLAFNAALQQALAQTGNRLLQGQAGAQAQSGIKSALAGEGDFGLQMLALNALGGQLPTAEELGLSGDVARGYEEMARANPMQALPIALRYITEGRNPQLLERLAGGMEGAFGSGPQGTSLMVAWLQQYGLQGEQLLSIIGGGGVSGIVERAGKITPAMAEGQDLIEDVQGANRVYWQTRQNDAMKREAGLRKSLAALDLTGDLETGMRSLANRFTINTALFMSGLGGNDLTQGGSLQGPAGEIDTGAYIPGMGPKPTAQMGMGSLTPDGRIAVTLPPGAEYDRATLEALRAKGVDTSKLGRHLGYDFAIGDRGKGGDPITNPFARATVAKVGYDPDGYGNYVVLDLGGGVQARFAHLQETKLKAGQKLHTGDLIGLEGQTGAATGPHLHMEMIKNGRPIQDALDWQKLFERYLGRPQGDAGTQQPQKVVVEVQGLDNIRVEGVSGPQADRIRQGLEMILGAAVPQNHRGA